jgi:SRSO17 transposase
MHREDWQDEVRRWLAPFLGHLGHKARRRMCPLYVAGLIGPGERKSVQPMALRMPAADYDQLHHFIGAGTWEEAALEREVLVQADRLVGGADAVIVIDDTALPKKGKHSVGVAPQYATVLGKQANCQTLVSLTLARNEVPVPIALRLYLPEVWAEDPARLAKAGVPKPLRLHRSKSDIALAELDRALAAGVRFGVVLADAAYGSGTGFRRALSDRGLTWAVGIPRTQKVYSPDVVLTWPVAPRGRPRQRPVPDLRPAAAQEMLARQGWRTVTWRHGTKGPLRASFGAVRVRVADGTPTRAGERSHQHLPGDEEVWLIGERRSAGEQKYYLSNLPPGTRLKRLAATIKARWLCEQSHQQLKEELGLDHFEGRSWRGLHRHALMTMIAFLYLQHRRLKAVEGEKKNHRPSAAAEPARNTGGHNRPVPPPPLPKMSVPAPAATPKLICQSSARP